jgi:hypothetical protein
VGDDESAPEQWKQVAVTLSFTASDGLETAWQPLPCEESPASGHLGWSGGEMGT